MLAKVSAIVLAAGLSKRMEGGKKLFLPYGSRTILEEVLYQLSRSNVDEVIVVGSEQSIQSIRDITSRDYQSYKVIENKRYKLGMTTSIQAGVNAAGVDTSGYMICLADMPKIDFPVYNGLTSAFRKYYVDDQKSILVPVYNNRKGNPVIFSGDYRNDILNHQEMEGCRGIVQENSSHLHNVKMNSAEVLFDIDTKEQYDQAIEKGL